LPFAARRDALAQAAPHGGLVWPLPSEAITWTEPNHDLAVQPRFDNLDALFLGASPRGFYRLAGSDLRGALSLHGPVSKLRLIHDAPSLARLRAAAQATVAALHDVLPLIKPGVPEKQVEQSVLAAMQTHGCGRESFPLILASGPSAAQPHGSGNLGVVGEGTLLVADIGCTVDHYASDFTRTLPVSGKFTPEQRALYDAVHAAQAAALAACRPGAQMMGRPKPGSTTPSLTKLARDTLKERSPDHQDHMSHGLGHTVGLFVHDVINDGTLVEGMVVTIEPGTYLEGRLGIRIEDTYVVTKDGCEPLTAGFAADGEAIEAAMAKAQAPAPVAAPAAAGPP
jgi:Xaa-Pro aminopeptidase